MHHQELWSWQAYRAESQRRVTFRLGLSSSPSVKERERTTENKCPPRACNIYGMMFRSSPWCSSATLQTLRVPDGMWTDLDHHLPCIICIQNSRKPKSPLEHEIYSNISYTWDAVFALHCSILCNQHCYFSDKQSEHIAGYIGRVTITAAFFMADYSWTYILV